MLTTTGPLGVNWTLRSYETPGISDTLPACAGAANTAKSRAVMAVLRSTDRGDASAGWPRRTKSLQVAKKVGAACQRPRSTRNRRSSLLGPKALTAFTLATYGPE